MRTTALLLAGLLLGCHKSPAKPVNNCTGPDEWTQWGRGGAHSGTSCAVGQPLARIQFDVVYDQFVAEERAESDGDLVVHYQSPLVSGDDVFFEMKGGQYVSCNPPGSGGDGCGPEAWGSQRWSEAKYSWSGDQLQFKWSVASDWAPPPNLRHFGLWEPVFHAALGKDFVYLPGANGSVIEVARDTGMVVRRIDPFQGDPLAYGAGPIAVGADGSVVWTAVHFSSAATPWASDAKGYVVKSTPAGAVQSGLLDGLNPAAPAPSAQCEVSYSVDASKTVLPPEDNSGQVLPAPRVACGSQRPAINAAPAIGRDGAIYLITRAHKADRFSYLLAINPDLTPRWSASLRVPLNDGCGVVVPKDETPGHCHANAPDGIDPFTGLPPAGQALDVSSSSPVVLPDGRVLYGAYNGYNGARGHTLLFGSDGSYQRSYDFGWDTTPAFFEHDGTYSIVLKDNHYATDGPYYITQLDANLGVEWRYQSTNTLSCEHADGGVSCINDHGGGFEWCVNAVAVDGAGVVYANSEDGNLYAISQGGGEKQRYFLDSALGAAYTPLTIDAKGRIYTQNAGHLYVVGGP